MSIRSTNPTDYINNNTDSPNRIIHELRNIDRTLKGAEGAIPVTASITGSPNVFITNGAGSPVPVSFASSGLATEATLAQVSSRMDSRVISTPVIDKVSQKQYIMRHFHDSTGAVVSSDFVDFTTNTVALINPDDVLVDNDANKTMVSTLFASGDLVNINDTVIFEGMGSLYNVGIVKFISNIDEIATLKINGWSQIDNKFYNIPFELVKHVDESGAYSVVLYFNLQGFDKIKIELLEASVAGGYLNAIMIANTVNRTINANTFDSSTKQIDISKFKNRYSNHTFLTEGQYTSEQVNKSILSFIGSGIDTTIIEELDSIKNSVSSLSANSQTLGIKDNATSSPVVISSQQQQDLITTHTATAVLGENLFIDGLGNTSFDSHSNGTTYREFAIQVISAAGTLGGVIIFEGSNDNFTTTAINLNVFDDTTNTGIVLSGAQTITQNTVRYFVGETSYRYVRCRISTAPTGTSTLRAITKWGIIPSTHRTVVVAQPTAANLQSTATINISGTALQNSATPAATTSVRALPTADVVLTTNTDATSLARTASGNSGTVADDYGNTIASVINVSVVSGTNPTLDIALEQSSDGGVTWQAIYHVRRITTTGAITVPKMTINGRRRWSWVIAGTTPSFTFSIITSRPQVNTDTIRNFFDRTITSTNGSTSATFDIEETKCTIFYVNSGAVTLLAGQFQLQVTNDTTAGWTNVGSAITASANAITASSPLSINSKFARIICTVGSTGSQTINYVNINSIS